ncbi:MAG: hypothetical protein D6714_20350 [Bacteroidetes bacterium]|nr:MAG: hypothetical protein D6714_20350 [Bacteroidota bacterium]
MSRKAKVTQKIKQAGCFLAGILLMAAACSPPKGKTRKEVFDEQLTKRIERWKREFRNKCEKDILDRAAKITDSTLIANARARKERQMRYPKPRKPGKPGVKIPKDTTPVAPLVFIEWFLADSTVLDSILKNDSLSAAFFELLRLDSLEKMTPPVRHLPDTLRPKN